MKIRFGIFVLVAVILTANGLFTGSRIRNLQAERDRLSTPEARSEVRREGLSQGAKGTSLLKLKAPQETPKVAGEFTKKGYSNALELLSDMNFEERLDAIKAMVSTAMTDPEQRTLLLEALRDLPSETKGLTSKEEIESEVFEAFARGINADITDSVIEWLTICTAHEKAKFAGGLAYSSTLDASGRWLDWMSSNLSPEESAQSVAILVEEWTQKDYESAGKWLAAAAESPVKMVAVQAYVETIAEYEPQVAIQWATTLPEGPKRDACLSAIHANWPATDPEGRNAFRRAHNME